MAKTPEGVNWYGPTEDDFKDPMFDAIWQCIRSWDINVPYAYKGYSEATGNHVKAILAAIHKQRQLEMLKAFDMAVEQLKGQK